MKNRVSKLVVLSLSGLVLVNLSVSAAITPAVGVPLDGGLLTVLAAAGVGYFIRTKRKNKEI